MHYVIVWQNDPNVEKRLQHLLDRGAGSGVVDVGEHHVRLFRMMSAGSPKGEWYDRLPIWSAIMNTAKHALEESERLAQMHVMYIFHQTSQPAVTSIMGSLELLTPDALDDLAESAQTNLEVQQVVLLSCESAADKVVSDPVPSELAPWVRQAREMRQACFEAFTIRHVGGTGRFIPTVVTFSTGDVETGGLVLDPWQARFLTLHGHFTEDGEWEYDRDADGEADKSKDLASGTVYGDAPDGSSSSSSIAAGEPVPPLLPPELSSSP